MDAFRNDLEEHLRGYPAAITRGLPEMIEILPPGTSKAVGIEALLTTLDIPPEQVFDQLLD